MNKGSAHAARTADQPIAARDHTAAAWARAAVARACSAVASVSTATASASTTAASASTTAASASTTAASVSTTAASVSTATASASTTAASASTAAAHAAARAAFACAAALCAGSLVGCATPAPIVLHDAVGPWQPRATVDDGSGQLMVYSATRVTTADDSEYPVHTPYTIYGLDNKVVRDVNNTAGLFSQAPSTVSLAPGRYQVKALAADAGFVIVPVVIVPHKTTIVDLDGTVLPQQDAAQVADDAHLVRLPNGRVIGAQPK